MRKGGVLIHRKILRSSFAISLVISCACAAAPANPGSSPPLQKPPPSSENSLKKENLTYADRVAWHSRLNWPQDCETTFDYPDKSLAGLVFYQLSNKRDLVQVTCTLGSYQGTYVYLLLDESASPVKSTVLHFATYEDSGESGAGRLQRTQTTEITGSPEFDLSSKQLRIVNKFRGIGDCGVAVTYTFPNVEPELSLLQGKLDCDRKVVNPREWKKLIPR